MRKNVEEMENLQHMAILSNCDESINDAL